MQGTVFRYRPPETPVAAATTEIGKVTVSVRLTYDGDLLVCRSRAERRDRVNAEASEVLSKGLYVSGIDTPGPRITGTAGHRFVQTGAEFRPPDGWTYHGTCGISAQRNGLSLSGVLGYRLAVHAHWNRRAGACVPPASAAQWGECFGAELASIGGLVLRRVPVLSQL